MTEEEFIKRAYSATMDELVALVKEVGIAFDPPKSPEQRLAEELLNKRGFRLADLDALHRSLAACNLKLEPRR
jgi:hypothetical protein